MIWCYVQATLILAGVLGVICFWGFSLMNSIDGNDRYPILRWNKDPWKSNHPILQRTIWYVSWVIFLGPIVTCLCIVVHSLALKLCGG